MCHAGCPGDSLILFSSPCLWDRRASLQSAAHQLWKLLQPWDKPWAAALIWLPLFSPCHSHFLSILSPSFSHYRVFVSDFVSVSASLRSHQNSLPQRGRPGSSGEGKRLRARPSQEKDADRRCLYSWFTLPEEDAAIPLPQLQGFFCPTCLVPLFFVGTRSIKTKYCFAVIRFPNHPRDALWGESARDELM